MSKFVGQYESQAAVGKRRRRSTVVWSFVALSSFVWIFAIFLPPLAPVFGLPGIGDGAFSFFGHICHQIPDRSMHFLGHQLGVCSRCFGVYTGLLVGTLIYPLWREIESIEPLPRIWLFASIVPLAIDWSLTMFGLWENTHLSRFLTGVILGAGCVTFIIPALVEIERNVSSRRRSDRGRQY
ncbi:MAG TPA: DUF2085 domain-containing protein [Pyrinomonadaceae bacterium]|nr:DUF2085 domain-containing protein [Pyrinomonadaceae bacterium]HMP64217.1 DUF2085 domain-containing protein [Pyrinomonadaceae bacterium]